MSMDSTRRRSRGGRSAGRFGDGPDNEGASALLGRDVIPGRSRPPGRSPKRPTSAVCVALSQSRTLRRCVGAACIVVEAATGGTESHRLCERDLNRRAVIAPTELPGTQQGFGPDGTCWQGGEGSAQQCIAACQARSGVQSR